MDVDVTSFLDTPYAVQTVRVLFGYGQRDVFVSKPFINVLYHGALMSFLLRATAVTNPPRLI